MKLYTKVEISGFSGFGDTFEGMSNFKGLLTYATPLFGEIICHFCGNCSDEAVYQI